MSYDDIKMFAIIRIIRRIVHHFSYTSLGERKILETRLMESVLTVSFVRRESKKGCTSGKSGEINYKKRIEGSGREMVK